MSHIRERRWENERSKGGQGPDRSGPGGGVGRDCQSPGDFRDGENYGGRVTRSNGVVWTSSGTIYISENKQGKCRQRNRQRRAEGSKEKNIEHKKERGSESEVGTVKG